MQKYKITILVPLGASSISAAQAGIAWLQLESLFVSGMNMPVFDPDATEMLYEVEYEAERYRLQDIRDNVVRILWRHFDKYFPVSFEASPINEAVFFSSHSGEYVNILEADVLWDVVKSKTWTTHVWASCKQDALKRADLLPDEAWTKHSTLGATPSD